jgi:hypothetical protein
VSADFLLGYLVDGMNYTPAGPSYEAMRDGILEATPDTLDCRVWDAFADFGVGVNANGTARGNRVSIVEDFTVPSNCTRIN